MRIFWGHGTADHQIPYDLWKGFAVMLTGQLGIPFIDEKQNPTAEPEPVEHSKPTLTFRTYEGLGHSIDDEELNDLAAWLSATIPDV